MEPSTKKRKLAPKVNAAESTLAALASGPQRAQESSQAQYYPHHDAPSAVAGERQDFESFARHLQDAAMLIQRQSKRASRLAVSALLLSWESDHAALSDVDRLDQFLRQEYNYPTRRWQIPNVANPGVKLGIQLAALLENASRDNASRIDVFIIYYAGRGGIGPNGQLFWASGPREDAALLEWDSVRALLEATPADLLLLLDSCGPPPGTSLGGHGVKQVIAAFPPDNGQVVNSGKSFTSLLVEGLGKLRTANRFTAADLWREMAQVLPETQANGARPADARRPVFYSLTLGEEELWLRPQGEEQAEDVANIRFDEARILVCTTFVGDASSDLSYYHQWLQGKPPSASSIAVEGIFLGPPTMLLISMPLAIWNVVQHDKVCCFLGEVHSHNMLHLYERMVGPSVAKYWPADAPRRPVADDGAKDWQTTESRKRGAPDGDGAPLPGPRPKPHPDSAEMQEAAEQLKALSHVRHRSDESNPTGPDPVVSLPRIRTNSQDGGQNLRHNPYGMLLLEPTRELQCDHCSHAPFKDTSSLRKHIAAAHTRPFPCAFSFAGCTSTFGSKNEWKRHMASQHLCLRFYRCSECPPSPDDVKGSDFNRKDLFTQHLRRMHAPYDIKRAIADGDSHEHQNEWEAYVKDLQKSCLVTRRLPPQKASCAVPDCRKEFEGVNAWDEWTEHVGRHMEKGDAPTPGADDLIIQYALDEGIIMRKDGQYHIISSIGGGLQLERRDSALGSFESQDVAEKLGVTTI